MTTNSRVPHSLYPPPQADSPVHTSIVLRACVPCLGRGLDAQDEGWQQRSSRSRRRRRRGKPVLWGLVRAICATTAASRRYVCAWLYVWRDWVGMVIAVGCVGRPPPARHPPPGLPPLPSLPRPPPPLSKHRCLCGVYARPSLSFLSSPLSPSFALPDVWSFPASFPYHPHCPPPPCPSILPFTNRPSLC